MSDETSRMCPLSTVPLIIGILGATSFGALGISLYGACKLCRAGSLTDGKTIVWMTVIFYATCILNSICNMPYQMSLCYSASIDIRWFQQILRFPRHFGYFLHWITMCSIFFLRLKRSFHSTSTQLHKCHQHIFLAVMSVIFLLFYVFEIDLYTSATSTMDTTLIMENVTAFTMTLIMSIYSQTLMFMFVRRLRVITKLSETDSQSISIIVRQSILVIVSLMSSTLVICAYFVGERYVKDRDQADWYTLTGTIILSLDIFIDVVCVTLGLSLYAPVYYHLCAAPDQCIKSRCTRTDSRQGTSAMEIDAPYEAMKTDYVALTERCDVTESSRQTVEPTNAGISGFYTAKMKAELERHRLREPVQELELQQIEREYTGQSGSVCTGTNPMKLVASSTISEDEETAGNDTPNIAKPETAGNDTPNFAKPEFVQMSTIEDDTAMRTGVNEEDQMINHQSDWSLKYLYS